MVTHFSAFFTSELHAEAGLYQNSFNVRHLSMCLHCLQGIPSSYENQKYLALNTSRCELMVSRMRSISVLAMPILQV